ncbi:uncharacterized protein BYT42DRAFT_235426 [Radiomyces spectabilis]|uniref:uncharacterized protein n=1 Tax=Radiomyces spectabilis TaxID=64574 RepID=UPI00222075A5|nr:uncharacterized protein BYT42DRAFT_235426 [Radiomyces spectabilis]KAI8388454.1 hypothetical protein BYT42DRAFT_235426 [Radiomyces spectabilis]
MSEVVLFSHIILLVYKKNRNKSVTMSRHQYNRFFTYNTIWWYEEPKVLWEERCQI